MILKKVFMNIMKPFRMLSRNIRNAFKSVFRNFSLSFASISSITITLVLVALSIISSYNVENFTKLIKKDFTIVAFLNNEVTEKKINEIQNAISEINNVDNINFEGKSEIALSMMDTSEVFKTIMSNWEEVDNPLQDTFLIKVKNIEHISTTAGKIQDIEGVSLVKYGEGMVEKMLSMFKVVENSLLTIVLLLVFVTAFLIANTIKITIFSRKKEIEIMRLVGSSNLNIQIPFIIEGLFLGLLGSIIPIIMVIYGYNMIYLNFDGKLFSPFVRLVNPEPFVYIVSLILIALGILVGMIGSFRAVRKHLKI